MSFRSLPADLLLGGNLGEVFSLSGAILDYGAAGPGAGNLALSFAAAAGVDVYGNAYPAGLGLFSSGHLIGNWSVNGFQLVTPTTTGQIAVHPVISANASPTLVWTTGLTPVGALSAQIAAVNGLVVAGQDTYEIEGPAAPQSVDTFQSEVVLQLNAGGAANGASLRIVFSGSAAETYLRLDKTGANIIGSLVSAQPGSSPALSEVWNSLNLNAGFQQLAGFGVPRFQYEAINGGRVRLAGAISLTANQAQGTAFAVLPAAYRPTGPKYHLTANSLSGASGQTESLHVQTNGNLELGHSGVSGNYLFLDVTFELD